MQALNNLLLDASRLTGFSIDKINFVFCMFLCIPLGLIFRIGLHPDRVSATTRQIVGLVWGLCISLFCFGWETFILIGVSLVCHSLTIVVNADHMHRYVFVTAMGTLSVAHIYRQITYYGVHEVDFSGPLMMIVQKVIYVAFNVHDGVARDDSKLTDEQRREKLQKVPSLLEYFSYLFHYSMFLSGPICTFKQYTDFIDGSDIRPQKPGQKEPSPLREVVEKILSGVFCLFILFLTGVDFPITRNSDPVFIATQPFYWRVSYSWISGFVSMLRYYFAFKMGEAVNNMCGLGFSGYDENGKAKWDNMININILKFQFASNMKMAVDNWNVSTAIWLRRTVYERCSRYRTLAVFMTSALWHGFYPGYYLMFMSLGLMIQAARMGRRTIRPYFQTSRVLARSYDVVTCIITALCIAEGGIPFQLLEFRRTLDYWRSLYFFGHVWCVLIFIFCRGSGTKTRLKEKSTNEPIHEENKNWIYKLDNQGASAEMENAKKPKLN